MNVIMIDSYSINPDVRLEKEAKTLTNAGYNVTLLGWQRSGNAPKLEKKSGYTIQRINLRAPLEIKVIFFLPLWWAMVFFQLLKQDWDIVHATDLDTYPPALLAAKIKRKRIVYDIFDFYADMVVLPNPIRNFVARVDTFLMRFADAIIVVDQSRLRQIGKEEDKGVHIINNCPGNSVVSLPESCQKEEGSPFTIFYAGGFIQGRDYDSIIDANKEIEGIQIIFAGFGSDTERLQSRIKEKSNILFIGRISYDEVIRRTLISDLLFALYDPRVPNNRYASPNKLFEAMMCGKPILVNDGTSMAEIVKEENCGLIVPYGNVNAIKQAILMLKDNPQLCRQLGANGRKAYEQKYNWKIMERRLVKVYENL